MAAREPTTVVERRKKKPMPPLGLAAMGNRVLDDFVAAQEASLLVHPTHYRRIKRTDNGNIDREDLRAWSYKISSHGTKKTYVVFMEFNDPLDGDRLWVRNVAPGALGAHFRTFGWIEPPVDPDPA